MPMSKQRKAEYNKRHYQESKVGILKPIQIPKDVPYYDPAIHKTGDRVWIWSGGKQLVTFLP